MGMMSDGAAVSIGQVGQTSNGDSTWKKPAWLRYIIQAPPAVNGSPPPHDGGMSEEEWIALARAVTSGGL